MEINPAFAHCVPAVHQGFDPPVALQAVDMLTPAEPHDGRRHFGPPHKRAAAHPHMKHRLFREDRRTDGDTFPLDKLGRIAKG